KIEGKPLILHADNGGPMKAKSFKLFLETLGIMPSFSRPRVSNDNAYSESLFKTMKYGGKYPKNGFETLESARQWIMDFVHYYNNFHTHSGIKYVTPNQRHKGEDIEILKSRTHVYNTARREYPERWTKDIRNWDYEVAVSLNPIKEQKQRIST
ncbi:MAG: transposase, partial [Culicoidibacterales bacterium]